MWTRSAAVVLLLSVMVVGCGGSGGGDGDVISDEDGLDNGGQDGPAGDISGTWASSLEVDGVCLDLPIPTIDEAVEITQNGNDVEIQLESAQCGNVLTAQRNGDSVTGSGSRAITYQGCTVTVDMAFDVTFQAGTFVGGLDLTFRDAVGDCDALLTNPDGPCDDTGTFSGARCANCYGGCVP
jgi:hypothetical protein